ncbi:MAG: class I SAM-dependent methyltransferase [Thermoguttaceae bacterium]|nr:class I SAM-dependent methyltransferase [Thermoguttaceae bacterium]
MLDCPAGEGAFSQRLLDEGFAVTAADIAPNNFRLAAPPCDFADLNDKLPYPDASFDAVVCLNGLQRVWARARAVDELARVVKPGGIVVISFPNISDIRRRMMFFLTGSVTWSVIGPPHAFIHGATNPAGCFRYVMTPADVLAAVSNAGLKCDAIRATHYSTGALAMLPLAVLPLIFRWLSPRAFGRVYDREQFSLRRANSIDGLLGAFLVVVATKRA